MSDTGIRLAAAFAAFVCAIIAVIVVILLLQSTFG
jgi:hypothetical protein